MNTATLIATRDNAHNMDRYKVRIETLTLVACVKGAPIQLAQARFWQSRNSYGSSPVYCSVWLQFGTWSSGRGIARGYGYHKKSAALDAALDSAGVKLAQPIDGVGDEAMREAMIAIGVAAGHKVASLAVMT